jgi:hypothetical protein
MACAMVHALQRVCFPRRGTPGIAAANFKFEFQAQISGSKFQNRISGSDFGIGELQGPAKIVADRNRAEFRAQWKSAEKRSGVLAGWRDASARFAASPADELPVPGL